MKLFSFAARAALSALVVTAVSASANAGLLVKYDFENANNIASSLDPGTLAGTFNGEAGGTFSDSGYTFAETSATSEVEAPYATLAVSALAGSSLTLEKLVFDAAFMGEVGQGMLGLRFVGNGSNVEQEISIAQFPSFSEYTIDLAGLSILNDTLKLYVYDNDGGATARVRIDNVQLYGSVGVGGGGGVPQAPEPSTLALLSLGALGFGAVRARKRRQSQSAEVAA